MKKTGPSARLGGPGEWGEIPIRALDPEQWKTFVAQNNHYCFATLAGNYQSRSSRCAEKG
jgi:hypothetical protein